MLRASLLFLLSVSMLQSLPQVYRRQAPFAHTFSIVARDPATGKMAVGVQSHWFNVGVLVPWAEAGVGAIATQSFIEKSYGYLGLELLKQGYSARQVLDSLLGGDPAREMRQVAIIDHRGQVAAFTGKGCVRYASQITGEEFSVQSNMMLGDQVCASMARAYLHSAGKPLAERVLDALDAAQQAGGDIRGSQSAALILVPAGSTGKPWKDREMDIRVDDNPRPLHELRRLYRLQVAYNYMDMGDLATEKKDIKLAMEEYGRAMQMFPENLEMQYWSAVTMANNKRLDQALTIFKKVFAKNPNWREMTRRLPPAGLLTVSDEDLRRILAL